MNNIYSENKEECKNERNGKLSVVFVSIHTNQLKEAQNAVCTGLWLIDVERNDGGGERGEGLAVSSSLVVTNMVALFQKRHTLRKRLACKEMSWNGERCWQLLS